MAILLQESLRAVFYAPFYAALALDAYAEEGVEVRFTSSPRPAEAATRLLDGTVDVTWGGPMRVMLTNDRIGDADLVCFCEVVTRDPFFLVGRSPRPDFRVADLAGMTVATVSEVETPWLCLQEDMRRAGLDPATAIRRIADRGMAENAAALRRGEIDAVQLFQPFVEELVEAGAHVWSAAAERGLCSYTSFYTPRGRLAERRDEFARMVRAIYRTQKWLAGATGAELAEIVRHYFPTVPPARLAAALERYKRLGIWGRDPLLPREGYDRLRAGLVSGGLVREGTPYERAVDTSLAAAAIAADPPPLARR